jgi:LysM repeat protein
MLGAPAILALLLVILIGSQWQRLSPIAWARANVLRGVVLVEDISASIEPEVVIVMTPIVAESGDQAATETLVVAPVEGAANDGSQAVAMAQESLVTPLPDPNTNAQAESAILAAATEVQSGIGGPQVADSEVADSEVADTGVAESSVTTQTNEDAAAKVAPPDAPVAEVPSTATAVPPTPTLAPTATPVMMPTTTPPAAPTALPTVAATEVKAEGMAAALVASGPVGTATPTWTAVAPAGGVAQVAGVASNATTLPTPTATPTVALTPLPTPTPTPVVYQVRAGDTLLTIASSYGIEVDSLMIANDISAQEVYAIQPGQMLIVPLPTPEPVVAVANVAEMRLEAPVLLVPSADATVGCLTGGKLIWQRAQFIKDSDRYVLHLGFVNGPASDDSGNNSVNDRQQNVAWVLAQSSPVTQTEWELDTSLCELASAVYGQEWRWWVEVVGEVDGKFVPVSPPSEIRSFIWK